jgi:hypothetical protein
MTYNLACPTGCGHEFSSVLSKVSEKYMQHVRNKHSDASDLQTLCINVEELQIMDLVRCGFCAYICRRNGLRRHQTVVKCGTRENNNNNSNNNGATLPSSPGSIIAEREGDIIEEEKEDEERERSIMSQEDNLEPPSGTSSGEDSNHAAQPVNNSLGSNNRGGREGMERNNGRVVAVGGGGGRGGRGGGERRGRNNNNNNNNSNHITRGGGGRGVNNRNTNRNNIRVVGGRGGNNNNNNRRNEISSSEEGDDGIIIAQQPFSLDNNSINCLLSLFNGGLYIVFNKWRAPLYRISCRLINIICDNNNSNSINNNYRIESERELATTAFLILPGLVGECHLHRKLTVGSLLTALVGGVDSIVSDSDFAKSIIIKAQEMASLVVDRRDKRRNNINRNNSSASRIKEKTIKSIETMVRERRLGSAMAYLDKLQDILEEEDGNINNNGDFNNQRIAEGGANDERSVNEIRQKLAELNPVADEEDLFSIADEERISTSAPISVDASQIEAVIRKLPVGSSAGASGWTYAAIKSIFLEDSETMGTACEIISKLCNAMLSGRIGRGGWLRSRAVLIPKKDGSYRPLSIGESWYRLAARAALCSIGSEIGNQLAPSQLGCGISGGCEIAGRTGQLIMDTELSNGNSTNLVIISLDIKNAFGTLNRKQILKGIFEFAPGLAKWFKWAYGSSSPLVYWDGEVVGNNSTGCRQGDPLSALCFCVGIHDLLRDIQICVDEAKTQVVDSCMIGGVYAYMDDINIFVDGRICNFVAGQLIEIFSRYRLTLSNQKCRYLVNPDSVVDFNVDLGDNVFRVADGGGMVLLGSPTGSNLFRSEEIEKIVSNAGRSISALKYLSPWSNWNLLRNCITAKVGYIARVGEIDLCLDSFRSFDSKVDRAVLEMAGGVGDGDDYEEIKLVVSAIRSMPLALGGLGISRYAGLAGETACLLSRQLTYEYLEKYNPELLSGAFQKWNPIFLGAAEEEQLEDEEETNNNTIQGNKYFSSGDIRTKWPGFILASGEERIQESALSRVEHWATRKNAREICRFIPGYNEARNARAIRREITSRRANEMVAALHQNGQVVESIWLKSSQFKGSGRWLSGPGGRFYGKYAFRNNEEYKTALRMRLLLSLASSDVGDSRSAVLCKCGTSIDLKSRPFHALDCDKSQWFHIHRHNAVRDTLEEFLKKHIKNVDCTILREPKVAVNFGVEERAIAIQDGRSRNNRLSQQSVRQFRSSRQDERRNGVTRADLGILSSLRRQFIDVVVVNPAAESYRTIRNEDLELDREAEGGQSFAVEHRVEAKKRIYRPILGDNVDDPNFFVPFIVEATGRLGQQAERFIDAVLQESGASSGAKSFLVDKIGATIARNNAMMAKAWVRPLLRRTSSRL